MKTLHERIETTLSLDETFDYIADFANTQEWDPGVAIAPASDDGPLGPGTGYKLGVRMGGRVAPMEYRITTLRPAEPRRADRLAARTSTPSTTSGSSATPDGTGRLHGRHPAARLVAVGRAVPRRRFRADRAGRRGRHAADARAAGGVANREAGAR